METTTLEQPVVESERLLIFSNEAEINKITQDARIRANVLNEVISCGLSPDQIKKLTTENSITDFIFQQHLKQNKTMAQEYAAGKHQRHLVEAYLLPTNLENTQRKLLQWLNFPTHRRTDKYLHLKFNEGRFELDNQAMEKEFVMRKLKFYIEGADVLEYHRLESMLEYFQDHRVPNNQVALSSFLSDRFESVGQYKYKVRWTYFNRGRY